MYRERERTAHMVNELIGYFQHYGILDFTVQVLQNNERSRIEIIGRCEKPPKRLAELEEALNKGRAPAMEEYYDQLMSIYDENSELHLLSMMIDAGEVRYEHGVLKIVIERYL